MIWISDVFQPLFAGRAREFFPFLFFSCRSFDLSLKPTEFSVFPLVGVTSPMLQWREGRRICVDFVHFPLWLHFPSKRTEPRGRHHLFFQSFLLVPSEDGSEGSVSGYRFLLYLQLLEVLCSHTTSYLGFSNLLKVLPTLFIMP